jgi:integrase
MYFNWLAYALKISLETGRRRPEIANMRMSDIYSEGGIPIYIKVADSKVNNIKNLKDSAKKYVYVPVSKGLNELIKSDYEEYQKNKIDRYIVAPEITEKREERICDSLSRGFAHFHSQIAEKGEVKHFGCLRKSYLTQMSIHTSGRAQIVSGHSEATILNKHYVDPKAVASVIAAQNFEVFPSEENKRNEELLQIRIKESGNKAIER